MSPQAVSGMYHCGVCKAEYSRADHLVRHVRSHTKQRPFSCTICSKGFGRQDLLKRHLVLHEQTDDLRGKLVDGKTPHDRRHGHRVHQACRLCAASKLKCADEKPCKRCLEKNLFCDYEQDSAMTEVELGAQVDTQPWASNDVSLTEAEQHLVQTGAEASAGTNNAIDTTDPQPAYVTINQGSAMTELQNRFLPDVLGGTMDIADMDDYIEFDPNPVLDEFEFSFSMSPTSSQLKCPHLSLRRQTEPQIRPLWGLARQSIACHNLSMVGPRERDQQ